MSPHSPISWLGLAGAYNVTQPTTFTVTLSVWDWDLADDLASEDITVVPWTGGGRGAAAEKRTWLSHADADRSSRSRGGREPAPSLRGGHPCIIVSTIGVNPKVIDGIRPSHADG